MDAPFSFNRSIRIGSRRDRITGDSGALDGARAAEAQQGGAVSGEAVAGQAGRAPDPAFAEAAGADASAAGGAGPPGTQRRHGAAGRSGAAAGHRRPGGQVVVERPGELIPRCFWLLASMPSGEISGEDLLALYRKRGKADGHLGELMSVVAPALSSTSRRKSHYRGKEIRKREKGVDAFACNQVRLLLAGFGYQIMHVQRAVLERVTGTGWSLRRLAERVLRTPARFTVSGRRITMTTGGASAHWHMLARGLATLHGPSG